MSPVEITRGDGPIVLAMPHTGVWLPADVLAHLNEFGRTLADTDWRIEHLYDGLLPGATMVRATFHRYLIDANRDPSGQSLYPGQNTTGLTPLTDFEGAPIWSTPPTEIEIERRLEQYHAPYHVALSAELERVRNHHGVAILYDCHSIRSRIPFLFDGVLPDFNIGTNNGVACAPDIAAAVEEVCELAPSYTCVRDGRFKGGWTTRRYGRPSEGIHAIQMELSQAAYLAEERPPWIYDTAKSDRLRAHLSEILARLAALAPTLGDAS
ncbi:MAG: N-formylglutamate deformylase [Rhodobacteraceae bacterium]|nr:N-formylglutamate deformylase [Paracoccaceae bacterium]